MSNRALFLDDMETRHKTFSYIYGNIVDVIHVYSAAEALVTIEQSPTFDFWFLDHDLSIQDTLIEPRTPSFTETGSDLAIQLSYYLEAEKWPPDIVIHSMNPEGAKWMAYYFRCRRMKDIDLQDLNIHIIPFGEIIKGKVFV